MKLNNIAYSFVMAVLLAALGAGCKSPENMKRIKGRPPEPVPQPPVQPPIPPEPPTTFSNISNGIPESVYDPSKWNDVPGKFSAETVHFAFDSAVVKNEEKAKVASVADYLKGNAADAVRIEGNCDERGTEEYNRALGERRALALREELVRLGIPPDHVMTISYGEDRPVDTGHNEEAWSKNRRGDFILMEPKK